MHQCFSDEGTTSHWPICTLQRHITVKPVLSDHIKQDMFLAFQAGGRLLLNDRSAESSCRRSFLRYFHSAISNHLSTAVSMSPE